MTARIEQRPLAEAGMKRRRDATVTFRPSFRKTSAPFSLRCGALLVDYTLLIGIIACATLVARLFGGGTRSAGAMALMLGYLATIFVALLNFIVLPAVSGQTLGKWATGLRIERKNGKRLSLARVLVRHLLGYPLSFLTLGVGFLLAVLNANGRALHDLIAGTVVIRVDGDAPPRGR